MERFPHLLDLTYNLTYIYIWQGVHREKKACLLSDQAALQCYSGKGIK